MGCVRPLYESAHPALEAAAALGGVGHADRPRSRRLDLAVCPRPLLAFPSPTIISSPASPINPGRCRLSSATITSSISSLSAATRSRGGLAFTLTILLGRGLHRSDSLEILVSKRFAALLVQQLVPHAHPGNILEVFDLLMTTG